MDVESIFGPSQALNGAWGDYSSGGGYIDEEGDEHDDKGQCKIMLCERPLCPHLFGNPNNTIYIYISTILNPYDFL